MKKLSLDTSLTCKNLIIAVPFATSLPKMSDPLLESRLLGTRFQEEGYEGHKRHNLHEGQESEEDKECEEGEESKEGEEGEEGEEQGHQE